MGIDAVNSERMEFLVIVQSKLGEVAASVKILTLDISHCNKKLHL